MSLKIGPLKSPDEKRPLRCMLPIDTINMLHLYKTAYEEQYNQTIKDCDLLDAILRQFMEKDVTFQRYVKQSAKATSKQHEEPDIDQKSDSDINHKPDSNSDFSTEADVVALRIHNEL